MITAILLTLILILMIFTPQVDKFINCGHSAPNVEPPAWYRPKKYNIKDWATRMYPDRGSTGKNFDSVAYRFWHY